MKTIKLIVNGIWISMYRHHYRKQKIKRLYAGKEMYNKW